MNHRLEQVPVSVCQKLEQCIRSTEVSDTHTHTHTYTHTHGHSWEYHFIALVMHSAIKETEFNTNR